MACVCIDSTASHGNNETVNTSYVFMRSYPGQTSCEMIRRECSVHEPPISADGAMDLSSKKAGACHAMTARGAAGVGGFGSCNASFKPEQELSGRR